ncbi:unnamed protein product [Rotaria sordida]|uniref:Uncharacterized protein n=1 Tax=Rotaria sordida TaxID=392033 RepID=A0A819S7F7_9BILA|nr:unnamed protein product [Rotaria sordida]
MELIENLLSVGKATSTMEGFRLENGQIPYEQYYTSANDQSRVRLPRLMTFQTSLNSFGDQPSYRCEMYVGFSSQFKDCTYQNEEDRQVRIQLLDSAGSESKKRQQQKQKVQKKDNKKK